MKYRNLTPLITRSEFQSLLRQFHLNWKIDQNFLWLYRTDLAVRIYGFEIENYLEFDIVHLERKRCASLSSLVDRNVSGLKREYQFLVKGIQSPSLEFINEASKKRAIEVEAYFLVYLEALENLLITEFDDRSLTHNHMKVCEPDLLANALRVAST